MYKVTQEIHYANGMVHKRKKRLYETDESFNQYHDAIGRFKLKWYPEGTYKIVRAFRLTSVCPDVWTEIFDDNPRSD